LLKKKEFKKEIFFNSRNCWKHRQTRRPRRKRRRPPKRPQERGPPRPWSSSETSFLKWQKNLQPEIKRDRI